MTAADPPGGGGPDVRLDPALAGDPLALIELSLALFDSGELDRALALIATALDQPGAEDVLAIAHHALLARGIPDYHADILSDGPRNAAFAAGIAAAGVAGKAVLDIGSGSGLLAMMAARAGAARVVSCERVPALAATARAIVERNGLADRVRVVTGLSTALSAEELGGPFDVVVSEILGQDVVHEGVLPALRDAHRRLAAPGAMFVPLAATIRVAPVGFTREPIPDLADVEGFDLRPFARHLTGPRVMRGHHQVRLAGAPVDLVRFDFNDPSTLVARRGRATLAPAAARADGLAQWLTIDLPGGTRLENPPGTRSSWGVMLHPFERPRPAGAPIGLGWWAQHDLFRVWES